MRLSRPLVLASASPRRRELLARLGLHFEVQPSDVDETYHPGEDPATYVARLAEAKARAAKTSPEQVAVLGSDTTVVLDGVVLNKPGDRAESAQMLGKLRGREHVVHTGVALLLRPEDTVRCITVSTRVRFRGFSDATLKAYVASGEGLDKAGAYGIQDLGAGLVSEIHGSYGAVVGLPAAETIELLESMGALEVWP